MWEIVHPRTGAVMDTRETEDEARSLADDYRVGQSFLMGIGMNRDQPAEMIVRQADS